MAKRAARKKRAARATRATRGEPPPVGGYCETCRWWDRRRETTTYKVGAGVGMCRAGGPTLGGEVAWPFTAKDDWCVGYERLTEWDETRRREHVV